MDASDRIRQCLAVLMGGMFVASGFVVMFGDAQTASAATGAGESTSSMFSGLTNLLGEAGAGSALLLLGIGLTVLLFRAVTRQ